jgi:hypothetical protein
LAGTGASYGAGHAPALMLGAAVDSASSTRGRGYATGQWARSAERPRAVGGTRWERSGRASGGGGRPSIGPPRHRALGEATGTSRHGIGTYPACGQQQQRRDRGQGRSDRRAHRRSDDGVGESERHGASERTGRRARFWRSRLAVSTALLVGDGPGGTQGTGQRVLLAGEPLIRTVRHRSLTRVPAEGAHQRRPLRPGRRPGSRLLGPPRRTAYPGPVGSGSLAPSWHQCPSGLALLRGSSRLVRHGHMRPQPIARKKQAASGADRRRTARRTALRPPTLCTSPPPPGSFHDSVPRPAERLRSMLPWAAAGQRRGED